MKAGPVEKKALPPGGGERRIFSPRAFFRGAGKALSAKARCERSRGPSSIPAENRPTTDQATMEIVPMLTLLLAACVLVLLLRSKH